MRKWRSGLVLGLALAQGALCAHALPPDQVFERAEPGVWALRLLGADNVPQNVGSAVAIAAGKAVTSCAILPRGGRFVLMRAQATLPATLEFADAARDLCQLDVPGLQAPEPPRAAPRMGLRVYAIGYERGADLTIGEGLVARIREAGSDGERIQTNVPTSGWLLGAGLYDDEARLLGITTTSARDASNLVLAAPARWLAEVPARSRAAVLAAGAGPGSALPQPGTTWTYAYASRGLGGTQFNIAIRATAVEAGAVQESISVDGAAAQRHSISPDALAFRSVPLPRGQTLVELAPYLHSIFASGEERLWGRLAGYPRGNTSLPAWRLNAREMGEEQVSVPAGTFRATRIDVVGTRPVPGGFIASHMALESSRFQFKAWYAPEVRRYVKLQHETWGMRGDWSGEQVIELLSHTRP